eukprot:GHVP01023426.1.p1 GENE.GHVP01023426.1~~GHVP01023426.1.p1  ORF type:complete len:122 (+),score=9.23 GHVP01023426.1:202-567(+)
MPWDRRPLKHTKNGQQLCKHLSYKIHPYALYVIEYSNIEDVWKWAANKPFMTKLDAVKAFHAVPISTCPTDKNSVAFRGIHYKNTTGNPTEESTMRHELLRRHSRGGPLEATISITSLVIA